MDQFIRTRKGTIAYRGGQVPELTLPDHYAFGHNFQSLDVRLSRTFLLHQRWRLSLMGDAFNIYNAPNLSGYSGSSAQR